MQKFITQLEGFIVVVPKVSALQLWWFRRRHRGLMEDTDLGVWTEDLTGHGEEVRRAFATMQDEVARVVLRQYLIGSWSGLLFTAWRHPRILWEVLRRQGRESVPPEHWRDCGAVTAVERFVPHVGKQREKDLIGAAG